MKTEMKNAVREYTSVTTAWFQMVVLKANEEAQKKADEEWMNEQIKKHKEEHGDDSFGEDLNLDL